MTDLANVGLICPVCRETLDISIEKVVCNSCQRLWPVDDGVPHFVSDAPYWGELSEEKMMLLLEAMKSTHWQDAFLQLNDPDFERVFKFVANSNRANWQYLIPADHNQRALDIGAGMGTVSHALSARYGTVYALEQVPLRVEFMRQRFAQDGVANVQLIMSSFAQMPFPESFFDLIVLNGVLEWLPAEEPQVCPSEVQLGVIQKCFSLLRCGGYLYIGIENRLHPGYLIGYKDPHCGVPFVTILPRPLANWLVRKRTNHPYQNYLYSAGGYRRLLNKSGFHSINVLVAEPSYNIPSFVFPIRTAAARFYFNDVCMKPVKCLKRLVWSMAAKLGILSDLQYSFIVMGQKS